MYCKTNLFWGQALVFYGGFLCVMSVLTRCITTGSMDVVVCIANLVNIVVGGYLWFVLLGKAEQIYLKRGNKYKAMVKKWLKK